MEEDQDANLMCRVADGDEGALALLIETWKTPLINYFYPSLGTYADAEDLSQAVFIRLYKARRNYRPTARFSTFLFYIARRVLLNEYRRRSRKPLHTMDPADAAWHNHTQEPDNRREHEIEEAFEAAVLLLPENHRTAILLLKQQELSYQEIARIMGATESRIKTWIHRAREKLKKEIDHGNR